VGRGPVFGIYFPARNGAGPARINAD